MLSRLVSTIKSKLALIAFTGKLSSAENDTEFKTVKELTTAEFEALPEGKDEEEAIYFIKDAAPPDSPLITEERIEGIEGNLTELGTEVSGNTQDITALNGTVTSLSGTVEQHGTDISAFESTAAQHESDITSLETTTAQHGTDISALESGKADVDGIVLTGDVTGASVFNAETGKTEIKSMVRRCTIYRGGADGGGWYNIAYKKFPKRTGDFTIVLLVNLTKGTAMSTGILKARFRTLSSGVDIYTICWDYNVGFNPSDAVLSIHYDENDNAVAEVWFKNKSSYQGILFTVLQDIEGTGTASNNWILKDYIAVSGIDSIPSDYTQVPATLATIQNPVSNQLSVYSGATGGGYGKSFRFSLTHSSGDASRTPILIILGSQTDNQTSMLPITLYSNGTIGKPANLPSEFGTVTAEDGLVTISTTFNNRWAMFMIFYDATLVTILPA